MTRPLPRAAVPAAVLARATALSKGVALGPHSPLLAARLPRAPRKDDEHREQRALIEWRDRVVDRVPQLCWLAAIPNGGARSKRAAGRAKAEGVVAGIPDLVLPLPVIGPLGGPFIALSQYRVVCGLWLEMKTADGRLSDAQRRWHAHLTGTGYAVQVCRSAAEARAALCAYLGVPDPEAP